MKVLIRKADPELFEEAAYCLHVAYPGVSVVSTVEVSSLPDSVEIEAPDLVVIDSNESAVNSLDVIQRIRAFSDVPLVVLSPPTNDTDVARCLDAGADEYIMKPMKAMQFIARIGVVLRRIRGSGQRADRTISFGNRLSINYDAHEVLVSGNPVKLTPIEFRLLSELVRNEGRVLPFGTILAKVWGTDDDADDGFIKKYIHRLRIKLEQNPVNPDMLLNERGIGYKFVRPALRLIPILLFGLW